MSLRCLICASNALLFPLLLLTGCAAMQKRGDPVVVQGLYYYPDENLPSGTPMLLSLKKEDFIAYFSHAPKTDRIALLRRFGAPKFGLIIRPTNPTNPYAEPPFPEVKTWEDWVYELRGGSRAILTMAGDDLVIAWLEAAKGKRQKLWQID
jgi:hypothetical protein